MNTLLIFFAFPVAVIIISAVLEKLLKSPIAVASFIFAVFLVVTFAAFDETFLIATFAYTLLAFITATIVNLHKCRDDGRQSICNLLEEIIRNSNENSDNNCLAETVEDLLTSNNNCNNTNSNSNNCGCRCGNRYRKYQER